MGSSVEAVTGPSGAEFDPRMVLEAALPDGFEWDERELVLLGILERQARHVAALEDALAGSEYLTTTARGEPRVNPLVQELRLQYAAMSRTAEGIRLPAESDGSGKSVRHQRAARRRWGA